MSPHPRLAFLPPTALQPSLHHTPSTHSHPLHRRPLRTPPPPPSPHPHFQMSAPPISPMPLPTPPPSVAGFNPVMAQAMLRIRDPEASRRFYEGVLGMSLVTRLDFADLSFSLFFYAYTDDVPPDLEKVVQPERAKWLWSRRYPTVELTWNWPGGCATYEEAIGKVGEGGDEEYVSGNERGALGFCYLGVMLERVGEIGEGVEVVERGERFAVVSDPDGYHVRLEGRREGVGGGVGKEDPVFGRVVVRVKDVAKAVAFFARLGLQVVERVDGDGVTEVWMGYLGEGERALVERRECLIGLVHVWGTELQEGPVYQNGNVRPYRGFGHVGIVVDDIYHTVGEMEKGGYQVVRQPGPFKDVGEIAFVAEPSSAYWVEVIKREGEAARQPYAKPLQA